MNDFTKQLQNEAESIVLSVREKSAMRAALQRAMIGHPAPQSSPYFYFFSIPRAALLGALMIGLVGSGTVYAAEGTLPGDALYAIKIGVAEPLEGALQFTTPAKAAWHASVAMRRVGEAQKLVAVGKLSPETATAIEKSFGMHALAAANLAEQAVQEHPETDGELSTKIVTTLNAHSTVLMALGEASPSDEVAHTATTLATRLSARTNELLVLEDTEPASVPEAVQPAADAASRTVTMSMTAPESSAEVTADLSTTAVSTSSAETPERPEPGRMRAAALAAIASLESALAEQDLDAADAAKMRAGIVDAAGFVGAGDAAADTKERVRAYKRALSLALSLETYLKANAEFPHAKLLPTLLNTAPADGTKGE